MHVQGKFVWLITITTLWILAGILITFHEYFFLANYPGIYSTGPMQDFSLTKNLVAAISALGLGGLLFGLMELFYFQRKFIRQKFWVAVLKKFVVYASVMIFLIVLISALFNSILSSRSIFDPVAWNQVGEFIFSTAFWHPVLPYLVLAILTSFILQLSERFGPNEMWKIFTGKYFNPKEEHRIFMFLDLNDSTVIAEKLGNQKFYQFLNDFFHDIANVIIQNKGEVVEYVGDLVVISWTFPSGTFETRCLSCFNEFEQEIQKQQKKYLDKFDIVPQFKAAVHCGKVMIGEMGKIKKSIKFSGDVLNTTARVEKVCGEIGAKLAITDQLVSILHDHEFIMEKVSNIKLKGKQKPVDIYKVTTPNEH